jgi:hypothetical protein
MNGFDNQLSRDFKNTWKIVERVNGKSNTTKMDVAKLLDFYLRVSKEGKLEECNVWADLHFLSGGSMSAFDWLYEKIKHIEPNREALLDAYEAFGVMNWECVGNMFLHYAVAYKAGEVDTYRHFCSSRKEGERYRCPSLYIHLTEDEIRERNLAINADQFVWSDSRLYADPDTLFGIQQDLKSLMS